jgi:serine-type D-Ala-D-Ala carboxypeptidase (penicillin-binding protein 5/6)
VIARPTRAADVARAPRAVLALLVVAVAAALLAAPAGAATADAPEVSAPSALVMDASTGKIVWSRAADKRRSIASTTKLMTALLTLEREKLASEIPAARYRASAIESKIDLAPGERLTVADLMRALLLESANDAAVTLAEGVSGSRPKFVRAMNRRAEQLGLDRTHYANPIGLDEQGNYSSARDLARLAAHLERNGFFRRTVNRTSATLKSGARVRTVNNRNHLVTREQWMDGVKTGHTQQAGYVLVGAAHGTGAKRGVRLISVVLGTGSEAARDQDTLALMQWAVKKFWRVTAVRRNQSMGASVPIRYRRGAEVDLVAGRTLRMTLPRGKRPQTRLVGVPAEVVGPLRKGQPVAMSEVLVDGRRVRTVPLVTGARVPEAGLAQQTKDWFTRPITLALAVAALAGSVLLARLRRRPGSGGSERQQSKAAA